jgi:hypothetical protein
MIAAMRIRERGQGGRQSAARAASSRLHRRASRCRDLQLDPRVTNYAAERVAAPTREAATPRPRPRQPDHQGHRRRISCGGLQPRRPREYWEELTRRVASSIGDDAPTAPAQPKRRAPPTGNGREHAPASTRKEVHVTRRERHAMIEAGHLG